MADNTTGRFEVTPAKFKELAKGNPQKFDLKDALPSLLAGTKHVPRLVDRVFRRACDEVMSESKGFYCRMGESSGAMIFFYDATEVATRTKIGIIKDRIPKLLSEAQADESVLDAPLPQSKTTLTPPPEKPRGSQTLAKLAKEGLPDNPLANVLHLWSRRTMQDMATVTSHKMPLTRDMVDMSVRAGVTYLPIWAPAGEAIVGSVASASSPLPQSQWKTGEQGRVDLVALFGAAFQLCMMASKGQNAIIITSLSASTLMANETSLLVRSLISRLPPAAQKNLILNVRDMPKDSAAPSLVSTIQMIEQSVRAVIFETGILSYPDFSRQFPKLHAAGFDSVGVRLSEHEQIHHMTKYSQTYAAAGVKAFIMNVNSVHVLDAAIGEGFTYVSGPLIRPAQKIFFPMQKLSRDSIGKTS